MDRISKFFENILTIFNEAIQEFIQYKNVNYY